MKLIVNTSSLRFGGATQVAYSLISEFRNFSDIEFHVFLGSGVSPLINSSDFPDNFIFYDTFFPRPNLLSIYTVNKYLSKLELHIKPDCVLTTSGPSYWRPQAPHLFGYNLPLFIYPDSPYIKTLNFYGFTKYILLRFIKLLSVSLEADQFIVQTTDVKHRLSKLFPNKSIYVVSNTCSQAFHPSNSSDDSHSLYTLPSKFNVLIPTFYYPHKNLSIIPRILDLLPLDILDDLQFVIPIDELVYQKYISYSIHSSVLLIGRVPHTSLPSIYKQCNLMMLPTLAECFSASYPEAMYCKLPILTSDLDFAHAICGDAAQYFDPLDPSDAASQLVKLYRDRWLREKLINEGSKRVLTFDSVSQRAYKIIQICRSMVSHS